MRHHYLGLQARCPPAVIPIGMTVDHIHWLVPDQRPDRLHISAVHHPSAGRAVPAVIMGLAGEVGEVNGQRLALPRTIERVHPRDGSEKRLWTELLKQVEKGLDDRIEPAASHRALALVVRRAAFSVS